MSLIRAHEVQYEGYRMYNWKGRTSKDRERKFPQVITIFSAPKYTDNYNNKGAIIKFDVNIYTYIFFWFYNYLYIQTITWVFIKLYL